MKNLKYLILLVIYLAFVIAFSLTPNPLGDTISNTGMYSVHIFEYCVLSSLFLKVFTNFKLKKPFLTAILACFLIGVLTEFLQLFISYRTFNPIDIVADMIGASLILVLK